jgi:DNA-binding NtrC family response regulator
MIRDLLLLQRPQSALDLRDTLCEEGWAPKHVIDPETIAVRPLPTDCGVGIAVIDGPDWFRCDEFFSAVSGLDMEWIAVTTRSSLADPQIARTLSSAFFDFHTLPLDGKRLVYCLGHALGKVSLRRRLASGNDSATGRFGMVGASAAMQAVYRTLERFARVDAPVLVSGESGTGKELAALAIHRESRRRNGPFVPVNCGSISSTLMQAQLFGHEKGSFTGAFQRSIGSLEAASGGTVFLDEIADIPQESQASLLRFLQESTIVRIGSTTPIHVDARVVAASHVDLPSAIRAGRFREDLFYRLNVLHIHMPPLRERPEDIPAIARHVLHLYRAHKAPGVRDISEAAIDAMRAWHWPGNVREMINRVHKAMIMSEGPYISPADLGLDAPTAARTKPSSMSLAKARSTTERGFVLAALERNAHNMAATARELGISRVTLYRLTQRLSIDPKPSRPSP